MTSGSCMAGAPDSEGRGDTPALEDQQDAPAIEWPPTWYPAYRDCPQCGSGRLLVRAWWDDSPEHGGGCIGSQYKCTDDDCDYWEDE